MLAACLILGGCKIVPTASKDRQGNSAAGTAQEQAFDPDRMAADMWTAKVLPYFNERAGPFPDVLALLAKDPAAAGAKWGHRAEAPEAPWFLAVRLRGKVIATDLASRASTASVDTDGDGTADVDVQIGPVIRGTAVRDALPFVSFGSFVNQIDFAKFGRALNAYVDKTVLSSLPREQLVGRTVSVVGALPATKTGERPLVTPATFVVEP
jgi:predicted lipoprotein